MIAILSTTSITTFSPLCVSSAFCTTCPRKPSVFRRSLRSLPSSTGKLEFSRPLSCKWCRSYFFPSLCFVCFLHHLQNFLSSILRSTFLRLLRDQQFIRLQVPHESLMRLSCDI